jgi:hypothetical protein
MWRGVTAVIFDEIDQMAVDPGYASLWDSARQVAEARRLLVIGASATYSSKKKKKLNDQGAQWIECLERPFSVEQFLLEIAVQD